jgi:hypothetical protein
LCTLVCKPLSTYLNEEAPAMIFQKKTRGNQNAC